MRIAAPRCIDWRWSSGRALTVGVDHVLVPSRPLLERPRDFVGFLGTDEDHAMFAFVERGHRSPGH